MNYNGKKFRSIASTSNGEVDSETIFEYHQNGKIIWGTYQGGQIDFGTLMGTVAETGKLQFNYQHYNREGTYMTGKCISTPQILPDQRIRLTEKWQWTCKDHSSGTSVIEEIQ